MLHRRRGRTHETHDGGNTRKRGSRNRRTGAQKTKTPSGQYRKYLLRPDGRKPQHGRPESQPNKKRSLFRTQNHRNATEQKQNWTKRKKVLCPAPPKQHHQKAKSQVRHDPEPRPDGRKDARSRKAAKTAGNAPKHHFEKPRPRNRKKAKKRTSHNDRGPTGVARTYPHFHRGTQKNTKKVQKKGRQKGQGVRE